MQLTAAIILVFSLQSVRLPLRGHCVCLSADELGAEKKKASIQNVSFLHECIEAL